MGCGPACLSMLTGVPYADILPALGADFDKRGIDYMQADSWLADHGFATARKWRYGADRKEREPWPPVPFGQVHLCDVLVNDGAPCAHFVVMLADGTILDPAGREGMRLADYHRVHNVAAVVELSP